MKAITFIVFCFFTPFWQPGGNYPKEITRGKGMIKAILYSEYAMLITTDVDPGKISNVEKVKESYGLIPTKLLDSLNEFTHYPGGTWLRRNSLTPMTASEWSNIQDELPEGAFLAPAYYIGEAGPQNAFVPIPNTLVVDSIVLNEKVRETLLANGLEFDQKKSRNLHNQAVFKVSKGNSNTLFTIDELLKIKIRGYDLREHIRFENLPLLMERRSGAQMIMSNTNPNEWNMTAIKAPRNRTIPASTTVKVGVFDDGCELSHPDLNMDSGTNLDTGGSGDPVDANTHGTKVAGIIGAYSNSDIVTGVAPGILIVPIARATQTDVEIASGFGYAVNESIDIVNVSFGRMDGYVHRGLIWDYRTIDTEIENAYKHEILIVAASGNGTSTTIMNYPARNKMVMAVGASDTFNNHVLNSIYGDYPYNRKLTGISVVAPGAPLWSTTFTRFGNHGTFDGTSAAAPHVAGLAALIKSNYPRLSGLEIREIIESTTDKTDSRFPYVIMTGFGNETRNPQMGFGLINVKRALDRAATRSEPRSLALSKAIPVPLPPAIASIKFRDGVPVDHQTALIVKIDYAIKDSTSIKAVLIPAGSKIGFDKDHFSYEQGIVLTEETTRYFSNGMEIQFPVNPEDLKKLSDSKEWEAIVIATNPGDTLSIGDVSSVVYSDRSNVAILTFELKGGSPPYLWIFIILFALIVAFFLARKKMRPAK